MSRPYTRRYAVVTVVEARAAGEARQFVSDMLADGIRWDEPLSVEYVGAGFGGIPEDGSDFSTEAVELGMTVAPDGRAEAKVVRLTPDES